MNKGIISTYLIGVVAIVQGFIIANPDIIEGFLEQHGLLIYAPLIIAIIVYSFDYMNPRHADKETLVRDESDGAA